MSLEWENISARQQKMRKIIVVLLYSVFPQCITALSSEQEELCFEE